MSSQAPFRPASDGVALGAVALAASIRAGEISAAQVLESHLDRIHKGNPAINAIVLLDEGAARQRAERADAALAKGECWGPLHGVPFTVKDAVETAGLITTCGAPRLRRHRPEKDAAVVARLRHAGAILLGKTNVPAMTSDYQTDNRLFGRTLNPWSLSHTVGGSSGGGAAAIAAGFSPLEVASDVGGSIRLPAHYCGVFGLKPSNRRLPMTGHIPPLPGRPRGLRHLATLGFIARAPADLRLALELTHGPDGADRTVVPVPMARQRIREPAELRVAWTPGFPGLPMAREVRQCGMKLMTALADAGGVVEHLEPTGLEVLDAAELFGAIFGAEVTASQAEDPDDAEQLRKLRERGCPEPYALGYARGFDTSFQGFTRLLHRADDWIDRIEKLLQGFDAWVCPVAPTLAFAHMAQNRPLDIEGRPWPYMAQGWYCLPFSVTGHPVVTLPTGYFVDGLPCCVQVVGRLWEDAGLLDVVECMASISEPLPLASEELRAGQETAICS